jgi:hypothetical protein
MNLYLLESTFDYKSNHDKKMIDKLLVNYCKV